MCTRFFCFRSILFTKFPANPLPAAGFEFESLEVGATDLSEARLRLCPVANTFHAGAQDSETHVFLMTSYYPQAPSPVHQAQLPGQSTLHEEPQVGEGAAISAEFSAALCVPR